MDYTIVELPERTLIGPAIITGHNDPECGQKIGELWQKLMVQGLIQQIPSPVLEPYGCFGAYYDYNFENMTYATLAGCESTATEAPEGMSLVAIPAGKYAKFSIHGDVVSAVGKAWEEIWAMEDIMAMRANTVDFEAYAPVEDNQETEQEADIDIFIALK